MFLNFASFTNGLNIDHSRAILFNEAHKVRQLSLSRGFGRFGRADKKVKVSEERTADLDNIIELHLGKNSLS